MVCRPGRSEHHLLFTTPPAWALMQHSFMLHSDRHTYSLWRPDMKQAAAFSEVRGKHTTRVCKSDMNTVHLTGVCVHTDFPLRPLSEPGCGPCEGLRACQTCLSSVVVSLLDSCLVKLSACINVSNFVFQGSRTLSILNFNYTSDSRSLCLFLCSSSGTKLLVFDVM